MTSRAFCTGVVPLGGWGFGSSSRTSQSQSLQSQSAEHVSDFRLCRVALQSKCGKSFASDGNAFDGGHIGTRHLCAGRGAKLINDEICTRFCLIHQEIGWNWGGLNKGQSRYPGSALIVSEFKNQMSAFHAVPKGFDLFEEARGFGVILL